MKMTVFFIALALAAAACKDDAAERSRERANQYVKEFDKYVEESNKQIDKILHEESPAELKAKEQERKIDDLRMELRERCERLYGTDESSWPGMCKDRTVHGYPTAR